MIRCNVSKNCKEETWYLDSGCSRHMTGNLAHLKDYKRQYEGTVPFGDEKKSEFVGKGTLYVEGLPELNNVQYVEGIKAYLIIIHTPAYYFFIIRG